MASPVSAAAFPALLAGAQRGDPTPLRVLYDAYAPAVAGYLRSRGASDVEDLTSEVFLTVFTRLASFTGGEDRFRSFVFTVAHARLVDDHRRRARRPEVTPYEPAQDDRTSDSAEAVALQRLGTDRVRRLLDGLSADQRDVLLLRLLGDLTVDQVAGTLGKSVGAVKQLQRRGLACLKRALESEGVPL